MAYYDGVVQGFTWGVLRGGAFGSAGVQALLSGVYAGVRMVLPIPQILVFNAPKKIVELI